MEKASASSWRRMEERYNLLANECKNCGAVYFPQRIVCRKCGRHTKMESRELSGNGTVYSYTRTHSPADAFEEESPYLIGVIELDEGPRVEGHIVENGKEVTIGTKVRPVFRRMYADGEEGLIHYHFKFAPV
jgi:uncharacterized OB-fold protein